MASTPVKTATPTGRSTRATFFGVDMEYSNSTDLAEDSSVDASHFFSETMSAQSQSFRLASPRAGTPRAGTPRAGTPRGAADFSQPRRMGTLPEESEALETTTTTRIPQGDALDVSEGRPVPTMALLNDLNEAEKQQNKSCGSVGLCTVPTSETGQTSVKITKIESATLHASNVNSKLNVGLQRDDSLFDGVYDAMPEDEKITAWAIHIALGFFLFLVVVAVGLSFFVLEAYGAFTLFFVGIVVAFAVFLAVFVDKTILSRNPKLKPIRRKIGLIVQAAKQAVVDEYLLFHQEWKEHTLMLTDGVVEEAEQDEEQPTGVPQIQVPKRKKSVMFRFVKPFVGLPRKLFKRRRKKNKNTTPASMEGGYAPPIPSVE